MTMPIVHVEIERSGDGFEVRWRDKIQECKDLNDMLILVKNLYLG